MRPFFTAKNSPTSRLLLVATFWLVIPSFIRHARLQVDCAAAGATDRNSTPAQVSISRITEAPRTPVSPRRAFYQATDEPIDLKQGGMMHPLTNRETSAAPDRFRDGVHMAKLNLGSKRTNTN